MHSSVSSHPRLLIPIIQDRKALFPCWYQVLIAVRVVCCLFLPPLPPRPSNDARRLSARDLDLEEMLVNGKSSVGTGNHYSISTR